MAELKPCPCGSPAELRHYHVACLQKGSRRLSQVVCTNLKRTHQSPDCDTDEDAIERWNTRTDSARLAELEQANARLDGLRREGRQLLHRLVKYVREDRAVTPGLTRLERLTAQVDDYLERTSDPRDILRSSTPAAECGPKFNRTAVADTGDYASLCEVCQLETDGPHSWEDCARHSAAEAVRNLDAAIDLQVERDAARRQVERLREGLRFYADGPGLEHLEDNGQRARALLDELGKGSNES